MQVQLSPEAAEFVQRKLASGEFASPGEVIDEAVEFFESHEPTMESLKAMIAEGLADEAAGRIAPLDMDEVRREIRRKLSSRQGFVANEETIKMAFVG